MKEMEQKLIFNEPSTSRCNGHMQGSQFCVPVVPDKVQTSDPYRCTKILVHQYIPSFSKTSKAEKIKNEITRYRACTWAIRDGTSLPPDFTVPIPGIPPDLP